MKTIICLVSSVLLISGLLVQPAGAQDVSKKSESQGAVAPAGERFLELIATEGEWTKILTEGAVPVTLSGLTLDVFTREQWKQLSKEQLEALRSKDPRIRDVAVHNIIYLSQFYRDKTHFRKAGGPLLDLYLFSRDDQHRIMALAGIHAVGDRDAMATLVQRVKLERSPRVRKLTLAALADYYGVRDYYNRPAEKTTPQEENPEREIAATRQ